jgi:hypothetical protein
MYIFIHTFTFTVKEDETSYMILMSCLNI